MRNSNTFQIVRNMVMGHLKNADKQLGEDGEPGPKPCESYAAALGTAAGAYAGGGISVAQWSQLDAEIRGHRDSGR